MISGLRRRRHATATHHVSVPTDAQTGVCLRATLNGASTCTALAERNADEFGSESNAAPVAVSATCAHQVGNEYLCQVFTTPELGAPTMYDAAYDGHNIEYKQAQP
jgi:hypothetical protein